MSAEECPHGDDAATCPPCRRGRGADASLAVPPEVSGRCGPVIFARYDGSCSPCGLPIHAGQAIVPVGHRDGSVAYVHESCAP